MQRTLKLATLCAGLTLAVLPTLVSAQEKIQITIGASHPPVVPWVGKLTETFIPEANRILAETGKYTLSFNEQYSGTLYKVNETLTAVSEGLTDIGWVFSLAEGSRLPLNNITAFLPGVTGDGLLLAQVFNELNDINPALQAEWDKQNTVFLAATGADTHHIFTTFPWNSIDELRGKKISAAGALGTWLSGTGAVPVDGSATGFYTDAATRLTDGANIPLTVVNGIKYFEVAPNMKEIDLGTTYFGALAANKDFWANLPLEIQDALTEASRTYSVAVAEETKARVAKIMDFVRTQGPSQTPPIVLSTLSEEQRAAWFSALPNLAQEWVDANEARGLPARALLEDYMTKARALGATPDRNWDQELN